MKKNTILIESWIWENETHKLVKSMIKGRSLNVCAGTSTLGDQKVDLDPKSDEVIEADMNQLPYPNNSFDTVISDPPWKIGFYDRFRPFFECVRVCKVGGLVIYNAYWIPEARNAELLNTWIRAKRSYTNTSIICLFKKTSEERINELPPWAIDNDQTFLEV